MSHEHHTGHDCADCDHGNAQSTGGTMMMGQQGPDDMDPAFVAQISALLRRGRSGFERLAKLAQEVNAKVASLDADVAGKAYLAASLCNSVQQDLGFYCQMMSINPEFAQAFPEENADDFARQWIGSIMPNMVQQFFSQGLNPVVITLQNPRNLERLFSEVERSLDSAAALVAQAGQVEDQTADAPADNVDPVLSSVFQTILRLNASIKKVTGISNRLAVESESDDDACLAAEVQFTVMRTSTALARIEAELALPGVYAANPPAQINRFLLAWASYREHVARTAFAQGANGEVFLRNGPHVALERLQVLEDNLRQIAQRLPAIEGADVDPGIGQSV